MIEFSLILATYGRSKEVYEFIDSLISQKICKQSFELIIVDQNDEIDISDVQYKYNTINIIYVKSQIRGLSRNRNLGLTYASGKYIAFPDDDCTYYPDTLSNAIALFNERKNVDVFLGAIYDVESGVDILRQWPISDVEINKINFYKLVSSITIFSKKVDKLFDENLGAGSLYGSNEDVDYIYSCLRLNLKVSYTKSIKVWHPEQRFTNINSEKVYSYGVGFGAFVAKYKSIELFMLFGIAILFHFIKLLRCLLFLNIGGVKSCSIAIYSRFVGLLSWVDVK